MSTPDRIELRPCTDGDLEFLYRVYASTREEELAVTGWSPGDKESFLRWQFAAQHTHYQGNYIGAAFDLILIDSVPAGRLYVYRSDGEIRVMDIALLPEFRGRGTGTARIQAILREAQADGRKVTLYVEFENPAQRLYARLGFRKAGENGVYTLLEWLPA